LGQNLNAELDSLFALYDKSLMGSLAISKNRNIIYSKAIGFSKYTAGDKK